MIVITWRQDLGIYMYLNGGLVAKDKFFKYYLRDYSPSDMFTIGCSILKAANSFAKFQIATVTISPYYSTVDEIMKFSPPLILRPTFDWFFMLIQNGTTLTSPPLRVNGDVTASENGLSFNGESGWVDAGTLDGKTTVVCFSYC